MPNEAYFAGFFDADGSIGIAPPRDTSLYLLHVSVAQVHPEPLLLFKERFGGKMIGPTQVRNDNARAIYRWSAETKVAEAFLRVVLPYLVVKRERAALALEFRVLFRGANVIPRGKGCERPQSVQKRERIMDARRVMYDQMRVLNRRGKPNVETH